MITPSSLPPLHKQAIAIVEQLQKLGFPNKMSIQNMEALVQKLHDLSPHLEQVHQLSIKQIDVIIQKIKSVLKNEEEVPVRMYSSLYAQLVILDANLYTYTQVT